MYGRNLKAYKKTSIDADLAVADPYRVIQLLYEGLLTSIAKARFAIEKKDIERKASETDRAIRIVSSMIPTTRPRGRSARTSSTCTRSGMTG